MSHRHMRRGFNMDIQVKPVLGKQHGPNNEDGNEKEAPLNYGLSFDVRVSLETFVYESSRKCNCAAEIRRL